MKSSSRSAVASGRRPARAGASLAPMLALACLAGCGADPAPPRAAASPNDARALAADLDALQRQPEPASDDVIAALERTLREQREKRARGGVPAASMAVVSPGAATPGAALPTAPLKSAPVVVAAASTPSKPARATKGQARAASAAAGRQVALARPGAAAPDVAPSPGATALPPRRSADAMALPATIHTSAATVTGPVRTPMSPTAESHLPVDELFARAHDLELQSQVIPAIGLYREASQRGHAASSQRLMELYADGAPGVARDYRVAVFFKERAVQQGANFDPAWRR